MAVGDIKFSKPLIIHHVKTKKITSVKEVWPDPVLISIDFDDFTPLFTLSFLFRLRRHIKHWRQCFIGYFKHLEFRQLSSRCLDIPMKHCFSCLIYYLKPWPNDRKSSTQHIATLLVQYLQAPAKRSRRFDATYRKINWWALHDACVGPP